MNHLYYFVDNQILIVFPRIFYLIFPVVFLIVVRIYIFLYLQNNAGTIKQIQKRKAQLFQILLLAPTRIYSIP